MCARLGVGRDLGNLPVRDVFADIRAEFPKPEQLMQSLNTLQAKTIIRGRNALAGRLLIVGPPGTGKTYLIAQICGPYFLALKVHTVLVCCPSNDAVDADAIAISAKLHQLQQVANYTGRVVPSDRYIIRLHSKAAEEQIKLAKFKADRPTPKVIKPAMEPIEDIVETEIDTVSYALRADFEKHREQKYAYITDARVKELKLSAGYYMLLFAGLVVPPGTPDEVIQRRRKQWAEFNTLYAKKVQGKLTETEEKKSFGEQGFLLFKHVLQGASVVITTTFNAGSDRLLQCIAEQVSLLIEDEAAEEREDNFLPLSAALFKNIKGAIMVGDPYQLNPACHDTAKANPLGRAIRASPMGRLLAQNFPCCTLSVQSRMVPGIEDIANRLTYSYYLTTGERAMLKNRPEAKWFQDHAYKEWSTIGSVALLNMSKGYLNKVDLTTTGSRFNIYYVIVMVNVIVNLMRAEGSPKHATIGVITGYEAQRTLLLNAVSNMQRDPSMATLNVDRIKVHTIDSAQGKEFDFVFVDILVQDKVGFMKEARRMNVALTRARNGLVILATLDCIEKVEGSKMYIKRLMKYLKSKRHSTLDISTGPSSSKQPATYPTCEYFTPPSTNKAGAFVIPTGPSQIFNSGATDFKKIGQLIGKDIDQSTGKGKEPETLQFPFRPYVSPWPKAGSVAKPGASAGNEDQQAEVAEEMEFDRSQDEEMQDTQTEGDNGGGWGTPGGEQSAEPAQSQTAERRKALRAPPTKPGISPKDWGRL